MSSLDQKSPICSLSLYSRIQRSFHRLYFQPYLTSCSLWLTVRAPRLCCCCCLNTLCPLLPHSLGFHCSLCLGGSLPTYLHGLCTCFIQALLGHHFPQKPSLDTSSKIAPLALSICLLSILYDNPHTLTIHLCLSVCTHIHIFVCCLFPLFECKLPAMFPGA